MADSDNRVNEGSFEDDNVAACDPWSSRSPPPPDLQVTGVAAPSAATSGQSLGVSWALINAGPGPTIESYWQDAIYVSPTTC